MWKHTDSNRGPSACKADALNQLSYASGILIRCKELFVEAHGFEPRTLCL